MSIQLAQQLQRVSKVVRLENNLSINNKNWMAWWYCGIYKNLRAESQPTALVGFRELLGDGQLSDQMTNVQVPLTALGQVRIGTVWRAGVCQAEAAFKTEKFSVDFTKSNWTLTSFHQAALKGIPLPYPQAIHPLKYEKDKNWLLEFQLPFEGKLVVPCLEFFTRCYGRSAELRRVLATYSWQECQEKRLYAPLNEPEDPYKLKVRLRKRLVGGDVILLAHAKYDRYTEYAVKSINAQIEALYDPDSRAPTFIKIAPWFRGPAELKVRGIWFDEGRSFLALQIVGCSDPIGSPILRGRENTSLVNQPADPEHGQLGEAWAGTVERRPVKHPEIVDLTGDVEPDSHGISIEIEDPDFEVLGEPRIVLNMIKQQATGSAGPKISGTDVSAFSSGETHGSGQGVGYAAIHAQPVMESHGALRDMWNAMLFLKKTYPAAIRSVDWFTFEDGYQDDINPRLIRLHPFDKKNEVDSTTRKWLYMDGATPQEVRGILVARVLAKEKPIHIVEIQRRPRKKKDANGNVEDAEEPFKGLAFILGDQGQFETWLKKFLSDVRHVKGVVQKLVGACPGTAATFNHTRASDERVPYEAVAVNALGKMGVEIPTV